MSANGNRYSFRGDLPEELARMAAIMCRATSMSAHMQTSLLESFCPGCGSTPPRGWIVRGPRYTVCNVANVFCFLDNARGSLNQVMGVLTERLANVAHDLV